MSSNTSDAVCSCGVFLFWAVCVISWFVNLGKLVCLDESVKMTILRIVGIFVAPLGAIMGWF